MKVTVQNHPINAHLLNVGMAVVGLLNESAVPFSGINVCSHIAGGLPRDMHFGVPAKDADIVVYGRQDWAVLNDHDEYFDTVEDNLHYMFDGAVSNMTDDNTESASSQPDNARVYRVYSCDGGRVNIIYYQDCYSIEQVVSLFDNTINAFWVEQVGAAFNAIHYTGDTVTAINNPEAYQTPERNERIRAKAAQCGLQYQDPTEIPVRAASMSLAFAVPYGITPKEEA